MEILTEASIPWRISSCVGYDVIGKPDKLAFEHYMYVLGTVLGPY